MKRLALLAALLVGCGTMADHPRATLAAVAVVDVGAAICAFDCGEPANFLSDGLLIAEGVALGVIVMALASAVANR